MPWAVENPANSLLWFILGFAQLLDLSEVSDSEYDACMLGGKK